MLKNVEPVFIIDSLFENYFTFYFASDRCQFRRLDYTMDWYTQTECLEKQTGYPTCVSTRKVVFVVYRTNRLTARFIHTRPFGRVEGVSRIYRN